MTTNFDDLARLLRRAEARETIRHGEEVGGMLGEMFTAHDRRNLASVLDSANNEHRLDQMRSERDAMRANELESRRLLGDTLDDFEERERLDLAVRRDGMTGYYHPADGGAL